ncbi:MAG: hypothetical protein R3C17_10560 [Planctomycetaceae bacterium]
MAYSIDQRSGRRIKESVRKTDRLINRDQSVVRNSQSYKYGLLTDDLLAPENLGDTPTEQTVQVWRITDGVLTQTEEEITVKQHIPGDEIYKGTLVICQFILGSWTIIWMSCSTFEDDL